MSGNVFWAGQRSQILATHLIWWWSGTDVHPYFPTDIYKSQRGRAMLSVCLLSFSSKIPFIISYRYNGIAVSDLPMRTIKLCSVVIGVTFALLVINTSSSVSREEQTTPLNGDECHQLATIRCSCVYNTWRSDRWQHAMKPDIGRELRFLPTPPAFDAPLRGFPSEYCHNVWFGKNQNGLATRRWKRLRIWLLVLTEYTNVADGQTYRHRMTA